MPFSLQGDCHEPSTLPKYLRASISRAERLSWFQRDPRCIGLGLRRDSVRGRRELGGHANCAEVVARKVAGCEGPPGPDLASSLLGCNSGYYLYDRLIADVTSQISRLGILAGVGAL